MHLEYSKLLESTTTYCNQRLTVEDEAIDVSKTPEERLRVRFKKGQLGVLFPYIGFLTVIDITSNLEPGIIHGITERNKERSELQFRLPKALRIKIPINFNLMISKAKIPEHIFLENRTVPLIPKGAGMKNRNILIDLSENTVEINNFRQWTPFNYEKFRKSNTELTAETYYFKLLDKIIRSI